MLHAYSKWLQVAIFCLFTPSLSSSPATAGELVIGQTPPPLKLAGEDGGRTTGAPWSSDEIVGSKIISFFYVDPEEREHNEPVEVAYKKADFPKDQHQSIAVLNMAAAWYPNGILSSMLEKKQKEYPTAIYLKDFKKLAVNAWGLKDDSVNLAVFDRDGKVLYLKKGPMSPVDIKEVLELIRTKLK